MVDGKGGRRDKRNEYRPCNQTKEWCLSFLAVQGHIVNRPMAR